MYQPKHIIMLVLLAVGFSPTAWAQSTALIPYEGATHNYAWNGISVGANFEFFITANADGSGRYDDGLTSEFDIINTNGVVGGDGLASTQIQWNTGASAHIYFVWLEATIPGGCSNYINIQISPQANQFDLLSENVPADHTVSCPSISSSDGFNVLASAFDAGSTTLQFKIKRISGTDNKLTAQEGDTYDWSFEPVLSVDPNWNLGISIVSVAGVNSGILTADTNSIYTVSGTDDEVIVKVAIRNLPGTVQDVKLKVQNQRESQTNMSDNNPDNDVVTHRIEIMPVIGGMNGV
jgi:hypothetical protein